MPHSLYSRILHHEHYKFSNTFRQSTNWRELCGWGVHYSFLSVFAGSMFAALSDS